jgi:hypothetical protein
LLSKAAVVACCARTLLPAMLYTCNCLMQCRAQAGCPCLLGRTAGSPERLSWECAAAYHKQQAWDGGCLRAGRITDRHACCCVTLNSRYVRCVAELAAVAALGAATLMCCWACSKKDNTPS